MNVCFFQCQEDYNGNMYLPYSSGMLWAYLKQYDDILENYKLIDIYFEKLSVESYLDKLKNNTPDIALFSNYGWNTSYHLSIAKAIKKAFPNCKIIIGGPNAQQSEKYLRKHDYVDISVWGEGELTLLELFRSFINNTELSDVNGLAYIKDDTYTKTKVRDRLKDINVLPSPYLTGIFDDYFKRYNYNFMPVWETNRGCPYSCTFCDLGNEYYSKVFTFDDKRLYDEIDWFSNHQIEYVEVADANFGIMKRDLDLTKYLKQKFIDTGYPQKVSATWAKSSPERIFEMSRILDSMNRGGITLALQSGNKVALDNIKRINIANDKLEVISKKYAENNMQTYHDFIIGLPGETLDSWKNNLLYILDINPEGWIFGHPLEAYENTEFSDINYIKRHDLKFATTPQVSYFARRRKDIPIEYGNYVIGSNTLSKEDYIECFLFKWFLITCHSFGWTYHLSQHCNTKLSEFYLKLYDYIKTNNCLIKDEYDNTKNEICKVLDGNTYFWGRQMFGTDDIYWDYESSSSIIFEKNRKHFFNDLKKFITKCYPNIDLNIVDTVDKQIRSHVRDCSEMYFVDFCIETYWYGRRKKAWKLQTN